MSKDITDQQEYDLRYSAMEDLPFLVETVSKEEVAKFLPVSSTQDIEAMTKNWIGFSRYKSSLTATYKGEPVGIATLFLMPYRKLIHHALVYFAVSPTYFDQGVAFSLVKNITHLGKTYFHMECLSVETYESSPLIPVLEQGGYREIIRQENFVKEPDGTSLSRVVMEVECGK